MNGHRYQIWIAWHLHHGEGRRAKGEGRRAKGEVRRAKAQVMYIIKIKIKEIFRNKYFNYFFPLPQNSLLSYKEFWNREIKWKSGSGRKAEFVPGISSPGSTIPVHHIVGFLEIRC